jgi:quinoprotein glucose dehydrogenase
MVQLIPIETMTEEEADREEARTGLEYTHMVGSPYIMRRGLLMSPGGLPCTPPPWGAPIALSLETGARLWEVPLGTMPGGEANATPGPGTLGSPNLGGAITTASGLIFIGATLDRAIRAYDIESGRELWRAALPAGGKATPMTYSAGGRQFVVIAAGGGGPFGEGDAVVAFALPSTGTGGAPNPVRQ